MEAVYKKARRQEIPRLTCGDAETWRICRLVLEQGDEVTAVPAQGANDPICIQTVDTNGDSALFFQHSPMMAILSTVWVMPTGHNGSRRTHDQYSLRYGCALAETRQRNII